MIFKLLMYVLSHGCLLSLYNSFFNLHTWVFLSCVLTSNGCKCLFVVYSLFLWEAYATNISLYTTMFPSTAWWNLKIPHPRHHSSWTSTLLPFILGYFFIARRLCINDVAQQCHITRMCLRPLALFRSLIMLFFILDSFLNCCHLFFGTSLILLFL